MQESEEPTLRYADRHRNYPDVLTRIAHFKTRLPWIRQGLCPRVYDRFQDLSPVHWQMLRALVAQGADDLFLAEDSHQRIDGSPVVLGRYGIRIVGRSRRLTLNYRTTAQNLRYALGILEGGSYVDLEENAETTGYRSARTPSAP